MNSVSRILGKFKSRLEKARVTAAGWMDHNQLQTFFDVDTNAYSSFLIHIPGSFSLICRSYHLKTRGNINQLESL